MPGSLGSGDQRALWRNGDGLTGGPAGAAGSGPWPRPTDALTHQVYADSGAAPLVFHASRFRTLAEI